MVNETLGYNQPNLECTEFYITNERRGNNYRIKMI